MPSAAEAGPRAHTAPARTAPTWALFVLGLSGLGLRLLRLEWQPLWWDEGYSVYFATESLARMVALTAQDIHPPLYYALLHGWLVAWGRADPLVLRLFSVLVGVAGLWMGVRLARVLYPHRPQVALWTLLLLAVNPMHVFYSQEVRMYGLEMALGMASTWAFWRLVEALSARDRSLPWRLVLLYAGTTGALLYTEYYGVLLPLAHGVWALGWARSSPRRVRTVLLAGGLAALLYLPWLVYAVPELIPYVSQKVVQDADRPLGLLEYLARHLVAFSAGHVEPTHPELQTLRWVGLLALPLLLLHALSPDRDRGPRPQGLLLLSLGLPLAVGFLLNLRLPFFPEGGERVLLFALPYLLLLVADGLDRLRSAGRRLDWGVGGGVWLLASAVGLWAFFSVPRYLDNDYRPLIRQTVQQGGDADTVFAVYPWQVGYWRAYAPVWGRGERHGPWPELTPSPSWNEAVAQALDRALQRGKVWFPAHLALGGILEARVEGYLAQRGLNLENRWYSPTTRLSAWAPRPSPSQPRPVDADFGPVTLVTAGVAPADPEAANQALDVTLRWRWNDPQSPPLRVTLRLVDRQGRVWSLRDYEPLGTWAMADGQEAVALTERVGLLVPAGVPPGAYTVVVGVGPAGELPERLFVLETSQGLQDVVPVGQVRVRLPTSPIPPLRLPVVHPLARPVERQGVRFLGSGGYREGEPLLAGTEFRPRIFVQNQVRHTVPREMYISLVDRNGQGVAGWEGWPLPDYPTTVWEPGVLVQIPFAFYLPATLEPGRYGLLVGFREPESGRRMDPVRLAPVELTRRQVQFTPPTPAQPLEPPPQFGTHARLVGYDLDWTESGLTLTLYWEALQPLLPPHHVFVHLLGPDGQRIVQDDGIPGRLEAPAPSGTWIPGEYIVDPHVLALDVLPPAGSVLAVGLYDPETGVRLPVIYDGEVVGDRWTIPATPLDR